MSTMKRISALLAAASAVAILLAEPAGALMRTEPTTGSGTGGGTTAAPAKSFADFNGDLHADECWVFDDTGNAKCNVVVAGKPNLTYQSRPFDPGWKAGRAWVDHNGDGRADYCRVVDYTRLACTVSTAPATFPTQVSGPAVGEGFGETFYSLNLDAGWDDTRTWLDYNGDGLVDYCRIVGNVFTGYSGVCTMSNGKGFGRETPWLGY
ncbi:MAG: hypothetical protein QOJ69_1493 [Actinomycetota bacterium]|jgi:hypothetical protein|nr:hypothetical protein [Actinomycetota bacterium]MEA2843822.1 hypothetical protein [Actinomycetota bacterium]